MTRTETMSTLLIKIGQLSAELNRIIAERDEALTVVSKVARERDEAIRQRDHAEVMKYPVENDKICEIEAERDAAKAEANRLRFDLADLLNAGATPSTITDDQLRDYILSLKVGERVIETGQSCMTGSVGTVYISDNEGTRGAICVKWQWPADIAGMGTSVTHGTRRISEVIAALSHAEAAGGEGS